MRDGCHTVLERLGAPFTPDTPVGTLSIAEQQLVEIARALHAQSKILVLDEPTTALSSRETDRLFALVRQLRADGIALIYISHRMAEVYELADRVTVLRDGGYVGTLTREELSAEALVRMMVGRDLSSFYTKTHDAHGSRGPCAVIEVTDVMTDGGRRVPPLQPASCMQGEVLGIARLGRFRPHGTRPVDLRCRPQGRRSDVIAGLAKHWCRIGRARGRAFRRPRLPDRGPQGPWACSSTFPAGPTLTSA